MAQLSGTRPKSAQGLVAHEVQPAEPDDCRGYLAAAAFLSVVLARRIDPCRYSLRVALRNGTVFVRSRCSLEPLAPGTKAMKFSIRDLMLVTVIVAILVAWGLDHWRLARHRNADNLLFKAE